MSASRSRMRRVISTSLGVVLLVALVTGCVGGAGAPGSAGITPVASAPVSIDLAAGTVELPLDRYEGDANFFVAKYRHALALNVDRCTAEKGFPALAPSVDWSAIGPSKRVEFLRWRPDAVALFGLDPDERSPVPTVRMSSNTAEEAASRACNETASGDFTEVFDFLHGLRTDIDVKNRAIALTTESTEGKDAAAKITECLQTAGVNLESDTGFAAYRSGADGIPDAVTQSLCAIDTGAITTLYTLLAGYQSALIAENLSDLEAVVERRTELERDLDQRIAAG